MIKEDWIECNFEDIVKYSKGKKPKNLIKSQREKYEPYINIKAFEKNIIEEYSDDVDVNFCNAGDLLMVWDGARAGFTGKSLKGIVGSTLMKIELISEKGGDKNFIFYFLKSLFKFLNTNTKGVGIPHVEPNYLWKKKILLPPLPIQRAIVKKIEQLFSALDAGIADLKKAQEQLKMYRECLLEFCNQTSDTIKVGGIVENMSQGWSPKCINEASTSDTEWAVIKTSAIQAGRFLARENKILPKNLAPRIQHEIKEGDILITRAGPRVRVGVCCLVGETKKKLINCDKVYRLRLRKKIVDPEFFVHVLNSPSYIKRIDKIKTGSNDSGLNLTYNRLNDLDFPYFPLEKQHQIVKEIESRLSVCDALEQQINTSLQQADALRQSILKKAFAGELLTEVEIAACKKEPDYEPASVLLQRIKSEKEKGRPKISKGSVEPKIKPVIANVPKVSADIHAGLIAKIIKLHEANPVFKDKLSHIKCEKLAHLVEYHVRIPLGRRPVKDAAGPDDYHHLKSIESRARKAGFFKQKKRPIGYTYVPGNNIDKVIDKFESSVSDEQNAKVNALLRHFLPFDLETAEIAATTYAGWNNLIILGNSHPSDEEIVTESRENWSKRKLSIPRERFFKAIDWLRKKEINLIPTGYGLFVSEPAKKKK